MNILDNVSGDVRTPDKLIDGVNSTNDGRHMWLAPVLPGLVRIGERETVATTVHSVYTLRGEFSSMFVSVY